LRVEPENPTIHEALGKAFAMQGKKDEAARHFQEAIRVMKTRSGGARPG
jgi:Flp pilus assembly protein TadD